MQGEISDQDGFLLSDLLQMLCQSKRKGCLELEDKTTSQKAFINIQEGKILNAAAGSDQDLDVITKFMAKKRVDFNLLGEVRDSEDRIKTSVTNVLMQCSLILDSDVLMDSDNGTSPHTYYTVVKGADQATGGISSEDNTNFKQDIDFVLYHSHRIGETLNMSVPGAAALCGPQEKLAMKYVGNEIHGVRTHQALNLEKVMKLL